MSYSVVELSDGEEQAWDELVRASPEGLPNHLVGWREVYRAAYGFRPRYLLARNSKGIGGVMPLFEVNSRIQGRHFTTLPGGVCARSREAGGALVEAAKELVIQSNARFLAIRDSRQCWDNGLVTDGSYCTVVLSLDENLETTWKRIDRDVRRAIRQGRGRGLSVRIGVDQVDDFYGMLSKFLRGAGTPVFNKVLLTAAVQRFGNDAWLTGVWHEERLIGGGFQMMVGGVNYGMWGATLPEGRKLNANPLMYWESVEQAHKLGCHSFDLGRSRIGSTQHRFKNDWGGTTMPIYQQHFLHRARAAPLSAADADEGSNKVFNRAWRRLPLRITQMLGPVLRRQVPFA